MYLWPTMNEILIITSNLQIPLSELEFNFSRSGGKGGQNVNKVETKVELLFDVAHSPSLGEHVRAVLQKNLQSRIGADGTLRIISQESRSQWMNRQQAVSKFVDLLQRALRPVKKRVPTKVSKGAKQKRLDQKKRRGEIKRMRRPHDE